LRQPQFPPLLDFFDPSFIQVNQLQHLLAKLLKTMPLDLIQSRDVSAQLKQALGELSKLVGAKLSELEEAEKMMLLANRFRGNFGEVDRVALRAEQFFDMCDFKSTVEIVSDVLSRNKLLATRF
jgi:septation ring formation regulator EzrA